MSCLQEAGPGGKEAQQLQCGMGEGEVIPLASGWGKGTVTGGPMGNFCHLYENWAFLLAVWSCSCRVNAFCEDTNLLCTERASVPDPVGP